MDEVDLESRIAKAIEKLPIELAGMKLLGETMGEFSENPRGADPIVNHLRDTYPGVLYFNHADGSGNSDNLWIFPGEYEEDLRALFVYYDSESSLNFYALEDKDQAYLLQDTLYDQLPLDLQSVLYDGPEGELLNIVDSSGYSAYHGSAVLVFENGQWGTSNGYIDLALEYNDDGGVRHIFDLEENS